MMVDKINAFVLKQKLDRHNLNYQINEAYGTLQLGGIANIQKAWLTIVVAPLALALIIFLLVWTGIIPVTTAAAFTKVIALGIGIPFVLAILGVFRIILKKKRNSSTKLFSTGKISLTNTQGQTVDIIASHIEEIKLDLKFDNNASQGQLILITKDKASHPLIGIEENDAQFLRSDLEYIKAYIEKIVF